ncbi:MAG: M56 family metallopeptidase [Candidatus Eremiobacteraeota bacterium]|nr:M56 family metallopeptidase [Candidatus Eremiobacteraeota bacterium]
MIAAVVASLLNAAWQSAVLVGVVWVGVRIARRSSASTRYAIWAATLIAAAVLPFVDYAVAMNHAAVVPPAPAVIRVPVATRSLPAVKTDNEPRLSYSYRTTHVVQATVPLAGVQAARPDILATVRRQLTDLLDQIAALVSANAEVLAIAWLSLCALLLIRVVLSYARLLNVKRALIPLGDDHITSMISGSKRPVSIGVSSELGMPCLLGFVRPAIALPRELVRSMERNDLARIVRHELAHAQRWDDVANAVQQTIKSFLWFSPAVYGICRMLDIEREIACDDCAVVPLEDRVRYAKCLTDLAVAAIDRKRPLPAPCLFLSRKQLVVRVERLLERGHNGTTFIARRARYALAILGVVALAVARIQLPVIAAPPVAPAVAAAAPAVAAVAPALGATVAHEASPADMPLHSSTLAAPRAAALQAVIAAWHPDHPPVLAIVQATRMIYLKHITITAMTHMHAHLQSRANRAAIAAIDASGLAPAARALALAAANRGQDSTTELLDGLQKASYPPLDVDDLIRLKDVGVTGDLVLAAVAYNGSRPSVDTLTRLASVGVDAGYLRNLPNLGLTHLDLEGVIRMKSVGVDPAYVRDMNLILKDHLSADDLVRMRSVGVDAAYVRDIDSALNVTASTDDLIRMHSVGLDPGYVRDIVSAMNTRPSFDDLVRLRSVGVEAAYIRDMDLALNQRLGVDDLIRLHSVGVDPQFVRSLHSKGIGVSKPLSVDDLIRLMTSGV